MDDKLKIMHADIRLPNKIENTKLTEKERFAASFSFPPIYNAVMELPPVAKIRAIPVSIFTIG